MPGIVLPDYCHATLLQGTGALNCKSGVIGGAVAGSIQDTLFLGYYIDLTAVTATTLTVTGLVDSSGTAQPWVINGQVGLDQAFFFAYPILNEFAPFTFQPSAAGKVWVFTRAWTGLNTRQNT